MVANAGLLLAATLAARLGLERLIDEAVRLREGSGAARAGAKVLSLVHAMLLGADSIDDCDVLRSGETSRVLGHRVLAPSTLGTFLRSFSFGHVRQLDRVLAEALGRAWSAGAGPGRGRLVIDVDSFVCEVYGASKQGAAYGYTHRLGYHPIIATRSDTLETLHIRMRKGSANTQRGAKRFVDELIARVRRAGATGEILVRADSGFWSYDTIGALERHKVRYSIGVTMLPHVRAAVAAIPEAAWQRLPGYPPDRHRGDRRNAPGRAATDRAPHAAPRRASSALARLAPPRLHHQPHRSTRTGRGRAPPARRHRTRHPRPQRRRAAPRTKRPLPRQRRLVRNRSTGRKTSRAGSRY
ncbi:MAG: IS1380 family transposase [Actinomycetota bacterium]|nr:IS1380 family transposase [Actinomycetota bacterium]